MHLLRRIFTRCPDHSQPLPYIVTLSSTGPCLMPPFPSLPNKCYLGITRPSVSSIICIGHHALPTHELRMWTDLTVLLRFPLSESIYQCETGSSSSHLTFIGGCTILQLYFPGPPRSRRVLWTYPPALKCIKIQNRFPTIVLGLHR